MASSLEHPKERTGDRISGLPDAVLCRILSFIKTKQAVQTSVLSHRWKKIWACGPNLRLEEHQFETHWIKSRQTYKSSYFEEFVNRLLFVRGEANIHSFHLSVDCGGINPSSIEAWISTAIRLNVVKFDLDVGRPAHLEIPVELLTCSTLRSLKLWLPQNVSVTNTMTPSSNCFSSLKFLRVTVSYPDSDLMEKVFSCFPVLEDLIISGYLNNAKVYNLEISAPRLKKLQINCVVEKARNSDADNFGNCGCQFFFSADVPNLEKVKIDYWCLVSYSLKNANCLRKAKIDFHVDDIEAHYNPGLEDRICQLFTGICHAKYLTLSSTIVGFRALKSKYHSLLPTFSNLNHLVLHLQTCADLESLATLLKISPNLEHLKILPNREQLYEDVDDYCTGYCRDKLEPGWEATESLPGCLHLKTLCFKDIKGCPNEVKVIRYLVKHGKSLNRVVILTRVDKYKGLKLQSPTALRSKLSKFQKGSKTCQIEFRTMI